MANKRGVSSVYFKKGKKIKPKGFQNYAIFRENNLRSNAGFYVIFTTKNSTNKQERF